jgi:hypothetical protein
LQKLPPTLDLQVLAGDRLRLVRQESVVSKRMFGQILAQQSACRREMERAAALEEDLRAALAACTKGRTGLAQARQEFTGSSLGILAAYRRRQQTVRLLHDLNIIRTLVRTTTTLLTS